MKPIPQTILHDPADGRFGDCLRACIASILEMDSESIPNFAEVVEAPSLRDAWNAKPDDFLREAVKLAPPPGGPPRVRGATGDEMKASITGWLRRHGYAWIVMQLFAEVGLPYILRMMAEWNPGQHYILGGKSEHGTNHSVVCVNQRIVWDPAPVPAGIIGPLTWPGATDHFEINMIGSAVTLT